MRNALRALWALMYRVLFAALIVAALGPVVLPLVWLVMRALQIQPEDGGFTLVVSAEPFHSAARRVAHLFALPAFQQALLNSTLTTLATTALALALGVPAAYSLSRCRRWKMRALVCAAALMPGALFLMTWERIFRNLALLNSYAALIFSSLAGALPAVIVVMTVSFRALPPALPDAALLDGASPAGAFFRVMLPAAGRGVRAAAGLSAIVSWNGFIFARTLCHAGRLVSVSKTLTLPVLLFDLKNAGAGHADLALVAVLLAAPALLLAMMLRRFFTPGPTGLTGAGRLC